MKKMILISIIFFFSCGEKVREEVAERFDDGKKKTVIKFIGEGETEQMIEKLVYSQIGDTLMLEKPLDKIKMVREYYGNRQISIEGNFKDGKEDGRITWYYENGQMWKEENYKDGKRNGKWTYYNKDGKKQKEETYKDGELIESKE